MYRLGFLGLGKMGYAIAKGVVDKGVYPAMEIAFYAPSEATQSKGKELGLFLTEDEAALFRESSIVILAIKPQKYDEVFAKLKGLDFSNKVIVSIAPGKSIANLKEAFPGAQIVRAMPNTPAMVGLGTTTMAFEGKHNHEVMDIFSSVGVCVPVEESQIDEAIPLQGSMPAYLFEFAKCFAEKGRSYGIDMSRELVLHAIIGSCALALQSGEPFDKLIDNVCSKGGSTIEGLNRLRESGFGKAIAECYEACVARSKALGDE